MQHECDGLGGWHLRAVCVHKAQRHYCAQLSLAWQGRLYALLQNGLTLEGCICCSRACKRLSAFIALWQDQQMKPGCGAAFQASLEVGLPRAGGGGLARSPCDLEG